MNLSRRSFLTGLIAAPVVMKAEALMPVWPWKPVLYGDGIRDDHAGLMALFNGLDVDIRVPRPSLFIDHRDLGFTSVNNTFALSKPLILNGNGWRRDLMVNTVFRDRPEFPKGGSLIVNRGYDRLVLLGAYIHNAEGKVHQIVDDQRVRF